VSSRDEHFASDSQWRSLLSEPRLVAARRILRLEEFSEDQVREFLVRLFGGDTAAAERRLELIRDVQDLLELSRNPRMLTFIAALGEDELRRRRAAGGGLNSAGLYELLVSRWLDFEVDRRRLSPGSTPFLTAVELRRAVTALALRLWHDLASDVALDGMEATTRDVLAELGRPRTDLGEATWTVGSSSLLTRREDDRFGFVHASVMEYLVAAEAARTLALAGAGAGTGTGTAAGGTGPGGPGARAGPLVVQAISPLMADFFAALAEREAVAAWLRWASEDPAAGPVSRANALTVAARVAVHDIRHRLAGQDLRGQDLSGLDLRFADLSGADLRGTHPRGTDLTGARLTGARLAGAVLDGVVLDRADLSGADLRGATLVGPRLRGARLDGGDWRRAALLPARPPAGAADAGGAGVDADVLAAATALGAVPVASTPVRAVFTPPRAGVRAVAFAPVSGMLAAGWGPTIVLTDPLDGRPTRVLTGHTDLVLGLAFGPDGTWLVSVGQDGAVRWWDAASGRQLGVERPGPGALGCVAVSPDGRQAAVGSADGTVWLLPGRGERVPPPGTAPRVLGHHADGAVGAVAFAPDGSRLASGGADRVVRLWDLGGDRPPRELTGHSDRVKSVAFHPDSRTLATGGFRSIRRWDVETGEQTGELAGHDGGVWSAAYTPDGEALISGGADNEVRVWRRGSDAHGRLGGHAGRVWAVAVSPDGALVASGSADTTVEVCERVGGHRLRVITGASPSRAGAAAGPPGPPGPRSTGGPALIAAGGPGDSVRLNAPATGRQLASWSGPAGGAGPVALLPAAGASARRMPVGRDGPLLVAAPATGRGVTLVRPLPIGPDGPPGPDAPAWAEPTGGWTLPGGGGPVRALAASADGTVVAALDGGGQVRLWEPRAPRSLPAPPGGLADGPLALSTDGALLLCGGPDGTPQLWDVPAARSRGPVTDRPSPVAAGPAPAAAGDPVGERAADAAPGPVRLAALHPTEPLCALATDTEAWLCPLPGSLPALPGPGPGGGPSPISRPTRLGGPAGDGVRAVAFSPDGSRLVTGHASGSVVVHRLRSDAEPAITTVHAGPVASVAFSPDGSLIVSAGTDGTVAQRDADGRPLARLTGLLRGGWVALGAGGGYKLVGEPAGRVNLAAADRAFGLTELDGVVDRPHRLELDDPIAVPLPPAVDPAPADPARPSGGPSDAPPSDAPPSDAPPSGAPSSELTRPTPPDPRPAPRASNPPAPDPPVPRPADGSPEGGRADADPAATSPSTQVTDPPRPRRRWRRGPG